jgi:hypothetical protein
MKDGVVSIVRSIGVKREARRTLMNGLQAIDTDLELLGGVTQEHCLQSGKNFQKSVGLRRGGGMLVVVVGGLEDPELPGR